MIFTEEVHQLIFDGYIIKRCVIQSFNKQAYVLIEDNDEKVRDGYLAESRFVFTKNDENEIKKRIYATGYEHLNNPRIAYNKLLDETIGVDISGYLFSEDSNREDREEELTREIKGSKLTAVFTNIKTVGDSMYAIGIPHLLYKRIGVNEWENLSESIPLPDEYLGVFSDDLSVDSGWDDFAGFSEEDMYLVGGDGAVWHYDSTNFKQCDFPSNERVRNVCCAGDGYVYIGGKRGRLWKGKNDTWELVSERKFRIPWKDIVWFSNRLFLGSDYGIWEFKDGEVIRAEVPDQVLTCSGALSICPEKKYLLTAGNNGASIYDGKEWTVLFDRFDLPD